MTTTGTARELRAVLRYAKKWGVRVELREHPEFFGRVHSHTELFKAPSGTRSCIDWRDRSVWFAETLTQPGNLCSLLHEIVHVVVGIRPDRVQEVDDGMLALEYQFARSAKLSGWSEWMQNYTISEGEWSVCSTRQRGEELSMSALAAEAAGLVKGTGRPTYKRAGERVL